MKAADAQWQVLSHMLLWEGPEAVEIKATKEHNEGSPHLRYQIMSSHEINIDKYQEQMLPW